MSAQPPANRLKSKFPIKHPSITRNPKNPDFDNVPTIQLQTGRSTLVVAEHAGAHALSWCVDGQEYLYNVPEPTFVHGKTPFRGGVPICWPAFATKNPKVGKHVFVRQSNAWRCVEEGMGKRGQNMRGGVLWCVLEYYYFSLYERWCVYYGVF